MSERKTVVMLFITALTTACHWYSYIASTSAAPSFQSQSHVATDGQSVLVSSPLATHDQILDKTSSYMDHLVKEAIGIRLNNRDLRVRVTLRLTVSQSVLVSSPLQDS
jgi:hypothetical protein